MFTRQTIILNLSLNLRFNPTKPISRTAGQSDLIVDNTLKILLAGRSQHSQDVVELVEVMFAREQGSVGQHLSQYASYRPDVYTLGVALQTPEIHTQYLLKMNCFNNLKAWDRKINSLKIININSPSSWINQGVKQSSINQYW